MPRPIIFLDVDGVLNNHERHPLTRYCSIDRPCAERLNRLLAMADAEIVMTSAWRYLVHNGSMTLDGLRNLLLSHWIDGHRLVGITRRDITHTRTDRGPQITEWLAEGYRRPYVVIDDMDLEILSEGHPWVETIPDFGLRDRDVDEAIAILSSTGKGELR